MDKKEFLRELDGRGFDFQDKSYTEFGFNDEILNMVYEMYCAGRQAQAVQEGFVLVSAEQLSQWGHMANYAEQYGCPECFEARGYAHSLACEINAYFDVGEAQQPSSTSGCSDEP